MMELASALEQLAGAEDLLAAAEADQNGPDSRSLESVVDRLTRAEQLLRNMLSGGYPPELPTPALRAAAGRVRDRSARLKDLIDSGCRQVTAEVADLSVRRAGYDAEGAPAAESSSTLSLQG